MISKIIFGVTAFPGIILILILTVISVLDRVRSVRIGTVEKEIFLISVTKKIMKKVSKITTLSYLIEEISLRFSVFNSKSRDFNRGIAIVSLMGAAISAVAFSLVITAVTYPFWYMGVVYSALFAGGICLVFMWISDISVNLFTGHMPETLRILNSRYASRGNIMKAIYVSMNDFSPVVRREMVRIYDALKQNDMEKINETFRETEEKYSGEYVTLMLELISHAYYNGGNEMVKAQFDTIAEDVIFELENKKDVRQAALSYIIMAVLFIPLWPAAVFFNNGILGADSSAYYGGITAAVYTAVFFLAVFLLIFVIVMTERNEKS